MSIGPTNSYLTCFTDSLLLIIGSVIFGGGGPSGAGTLRQTLSTRRRSQLRLIIRRDLRQNRPALLAFVDELTANKRVIDFGRPDILGRKRHDVFREDDEIRQFTGRN